ncbi:hypothetical protein FNI11_05575 [Salmonella enterica subsp. salamae]|nr:hypothetical protein [Salmonella enterica subsp. salamae]ECJ2280388.1 hypothetical protein [Salmonella enterica subsp. salamae]
MEKQKRISAPSDPIQLCGIEKVNIGLLNKQNKSQADGFIVNIPLDYVICITYFLKSPSRSVVCHEADE